tara:strand:+ start:35 stop:277 length:243 start_codon:yes stop_codon:yes gene_type:complete
MKRINYNDLLPWFLEQDHGQLPKAYLKSCNEFFRELGIKAASNELQATSYKLPGPRPISNANKGLIHKRQASSFKLDKSK